MYAKNEWDPLTKVIVGVADGARIPPMDISLRTVNYADVDDVSTIKSGLYPQQVIEEANEDLEKFVAFLKGEGVEVLRPKRGDTEYYDYCPRDLVFVHGDNAIATPMPIRARANNYKAMQDCFPTPLKVPSRYGEDDLYNLGCVGNPDVLALNENVPSFDAANTIRANEDILYLVSNSGNKAGARYLQEQLGDTAKVHLLEGVYSYMHIDSTVAFLREGLMLLNPSRVKDINQLPEAFRNWDVIWCPEPTDIGYYGDYCNASPWINMNMFSVSPSLVALEENQHGLRKALEAKGIDCAMLPTRHQRTLGGGFHCVTLDLERKHGN